MQDNMFKVSIRAFFAVIGLIARLIVSPLWLLYLIGCHIPLIGMFVHWLYSNDHKYREASEQLKENVEGAMKFWHVKIMLDK